jgi:cob(I)alamin adenosyltransferase
MIIVKEYRFMKKLEEIIEQYGRWSELKLYIERIKTHIHTDFSQALENAKALLESISKEICTSKGVEITHNISINNLIKKAFKAIGHANSDYVTQISSALATIGQQLGNLRNEIGITAHGKSLDDLKARNNNIDELTKEFLIDTTVSVALFLIKDFETENPRLKRKEERIEYDECEKFNEFWDESFGEFSMGEYSYTASEILFDVDYQAYLAEHKSFMEGK